MKSVLPILEWIKEYNRTTFRSDLLAGITVAVMLVPQGMAYAMLAGMPPIYGLYGGLVPLFLYAILGTSRQLSIGPVAVSALLVLAGISQLATPGTDEFIQLVILTGLMVGIFQILLSLLRMGFMVNFLSHPVIVGFTSAAAIIIAISQLKDLLGFPIPRFSQSYETLFYAIKHLAESNWISISMCLGSIIIILILRSIKNTFPGALFVVLVGTLLSWGFDLQSYGLDIVQDVPKGLPTFMKPNLSLDNILKVIPTVLTVGIIGVVESISIAKVLEAKNQNYVVKPNQELFALGFSKLSGAFFQALPTSGSFTRSAVNNDSGAKTGMASIFTALIIAMTLLFLTPLFYYLPKAVLAAIILLAVKTLFDFKEAVHLWKTHQRDFMMMMITFLVTLSFGIEEGVLAGVIVSLLTVLYRSSEPHIAVLGNIPGTNIYRNINRFSKTTGEDKVLIIRFDDQLYFANAGRFKDAIKNLAFEKKDTLELVVLDCGSIHDIDSSGLHALEEIHQYLKSRNIELNLTSVIGPVRDFLFKTGFMNVMGKESQFLRIHDAITYHYSKQSDGKTDWSEDAMQNNIEE